MKRLLRTLALIGTALGVTLGVMAPAASAGNCTNVHSDVPWRANDIYTKPVKAYAFVGSCSGVRNVQYGNGAAFAENQIGGIYDYTTSGTYLAYGWSGNLTQSATGGTSVTWWYSDPCSPGVQRWIISGFSYRIESITVIGGVPIYSWGSWHWVNGVAGWMSPCTL